jgi:hypothetical protein
MSRILRKVGLALRRAVPSAWQRLRRRVGRLRKPRRPAFRHLFEEAGLRLSATVSELSDWIRLGH